METTSSGLSFNFGADNFLQSMQYLRKNCQPDATNDNYFILLENNRVIVWITDRYRLENQWYSPVALDI